MVDRLHILIQNITMKPAIGFNGAGKGSRKRNGGEI
jgi:hypothetical protein